MAQIFCFGDSITYGENGLFVSGWVARLRLYIDNKAQEDPTFKGLVYNLGISGETTNGLVQRFLPETESRLREVREEKRRNNIFIFAFGSNDSVMIPSKNIFRVDAENFKNNLTKSIIEAKQFSSKIFIFNILPVVEELTNARKRDKHRTNDYIKEYNNKINEIVEEQNIVLIDVNKSYLGVEYKSLLCDDGLHPNDKGHELIFNLVVEKLYK